jgi:hypothetical protein
MAEVEKNVENKTKTVARKIAMTTTATKIFLLPETKIILMESTSTMTETMAIPHLMLVTRLLVQVMTHPHRVITHPVMKHPVIAQRHLTGMEPPVVVEMGLMTS